jgi:preprotein translocase subunit SecD
VRDEDLPQASGIALFVENVSVGDQVQASHFARVAPRDGETLASAERRLRAWLATLKLPEGARFAYMPITDFDEAAQRQTEVAVRTFLLAGEPVLRTVDVVDAAAAITDGRAYVTLTLSPSAAARFGEVSGAWVRRRLAIVLDGEVNSAPVVKTAITGGRISITLGQGPADSQVENARTLAAKLRP